MIDYSHDQNRLFVDQGHSEYIEHNDQFISTQHNKDVHTVESGVR